MSTYRLTAINDDSHQSIKTIVPLAFWPNKQMHIFFIHCRNKMVENSPASENNDFLSSKWQSTSKHHCLGHLMTSDDEVNRKVE